MKISKSILLLVIMSFSHVLFAADSGCGLGSVIIQRNSKGLQLLSWTTNGILLTQPLGIISGTSGCSSNGIVKNEKEMQYFVEINHDDLTREMSMGQGEKLTALARMNGCETRESQTYFSDMTKNSFHEIVPSAKASADEIFNNLKTVISADSDIQKVCAKI